MRSRVHHVGIATLMVAALSLALISPTFADDDRSKSKPLTKMDFKNAKEKFKFDQQAYKEAMRVRQEAREQINETFKATIKKATADAKLALSTATTAEQKLVIMNNLKNARTSAVVIRDSALAALGSLPTPPVEPKNDDKRRTLAP